MDYLPLFLLLGLFALLFAFRHKFEAWVEGVGEDVEGWFE